MFPRRRNPRHLRIYRLLQTFPTILHSARFQCHERIRGNHSFLSISAFTLSPLRYTTFSTSHALTIYNILLMPGYLSDFIILAIITSSAVFTKLYARGREINFRPDTFPFCRSFNRSVEHPVYKANQYCRILVNNYRMLEV